MTLNSKIIFHLMGLLLLFNGLFMLIAAVVSGVYDDGATLDIALASITTMFIGVSSMYFTRNHKKKYSARKGISLLLLGG